MYRISPPISSLPKAAGSQNDSVSESSDHELQGAKREVTTLKIKNLPRRCTRDEVLSAVAEAGFGESYDFFFLPLGGQQSRQNRGYAFVNFKSPALAFTFRTAFNRFRIREKLVPRLHSLCYGSCRNTVAYHTLDEPPLPLRTPYFPVSDPGFLSHSCNFLPLRVSP